ncbi:hypothetical protein HXX76_000429 [Chlamydomonas incerta]|uniref:ADP-ribosylation factor n=1 Tax=Chlamydomonas incerta TaxID=51695 RepID=A0A835WE90_CHLIN|nr:hypothetical protein HXX76_000429 [Chlamydomonas incerta]|eukprot:KAG2445825.1 hypothetical protein HXX76_000429 [Chlamydomonas incerta]
MSSIADYLKSFFPSQEGRVLCLGLDASGRTTWLYAQKLGEIVTTIPTIGFNVEDVERNGVRVTFWDVGGCDKIRPLWRHYFQNTDGVMLFVDSNDRQRLQEVRDEFNRLLNEEELRDAFCLVMASKQDLPNAMSLSEISTALDLPRMMAGRHWVLVPTRLPVNKQELQGHMDWLVASIKAERNQVARHARAAAAKQKLAQRQAQQMQKQAKAAGAGAGGSSAAGGVGGGSAEGGGGEMDVLERWLQVEDEPDDDFLRKLEDYSLDAWDHRTHLRLAWLYLMRHGRREGLARIHSSIQNFIANSPVTKRKTGTTYHETMTYFWAHMVHFCIASMKAPQQQGKEPDFKTFLLFNPLLTNGGLFLHYYSKDLMLKNAESRKQVVLPDKRPLPSLITAVESIKQLQENQARYGKKPGPGSGPAGPPAAAGPPLLGDDEFLQRFLDRRLDRWSHATMLRAVYCCLRAHGRRHGGKLALDALAALQGEHAHTTLNYFWLTMLTHTLAAEHSATLFADRPPPPPLRKEHERADTDAAGQGKAAEGAGQPPMPAPVAPDFATSAKAVAAAAVAAVAGLAGITLGGAAGAAAAGGAAGGEAEDWVDVAGSAASSGTNGGGTVPAAAQASTTGSQPSPGSGAAPVAAAAPTAPPPALPEWAALLGSGSYASVRLQELVADESRYLAYYTKQAVFSEAAAAGFVPPDKKPLPTTV